MSGDDTRAGRTGGSSRDPSVRVRILDAFVELVSTKGLADTSIDDVAAEAGVSKTTLYTRWSDRRSLIVDGFRHVTAAIPGIPDGAAFDEVLEALLSVTVEERVRQRRRQCYAELLVLAGLDTELRAVVRSVHDDWRRTVGALIELGKRDGRIPPSRDTEVATEVVMAVVAERHLHYLPVGPPLADRVRHLLTAPQPF